MLLPFDCRLTGLHTSLWNWKHLLNCEELFLLQGRWCGALLQYWVFTFLRCIADFSMDTSLYSSPIRTYMDDYHKMRVSNDTDRSDPQDLCSPGVVDLDLSLSPDAFGLRAFNSTQPLTRMLPVSSPCELRLLLPDGDVGPEGFHGVIIENLAASPTYLAYRACGGDLATSTMAESCFPDHATTCEGGRATPSVCSTSSGVGFSIVIRVFALCARSGYHRH